MKKVDERNEGMYDREVFNVLFEYEVTRARRYPSPLALVAMEARPVASNESVAGEANALFMSALNKHLRSVDIPSKSGNIYTILLPTTDEPGTRAVCERLLSVFRSKFNTPNGSSVSFSLNIGAVSHVGGSTLSSSELLQKVEEALKQSRLKGANTYVTLV